MVGIAVAPAGVLDETLATVRTGMIPGAVGALGAGLGLYCFTAFFAPASIPMSVLAVVLGRHSGTTGAMILGSAGLILAVLGLLKSQEFWFAIAALLS